MQHLQKYKFISQENSWEKVNTVTGFADAENNQNLCEVVNKAASLIYLVTLLK